MASNSKVVIIGGGFYGLRIAQYLRDDIGIRDITIIEKETDVMQRASHSNQARVHGGYHYPRSVLTALRSRVNLPSFFEEYEEAVKTDFTNYYAVARQLTKVSGRQFYEFFRKIQAPIEEDKAGMQFFDDRMIERVYKVKEFGFDTVALKNRLLRELSIRDIDLHTNESVHHIERSGNSITVVTDKASYEATHVFNTTYSSINMVNEQSGLPIIPLKHELTEMCLVNMPEKLRHASYTIMCGPFFSLMPFPSKGDLYTMSHVRYTPHSEWHDQDSQAIRNGHQHLQESGEHSNFPQMWADIKRYMPDAKDITYSGESLWEVKTVLPQSEGDDSRPILYKPHYGGMQNYVCIMGGKIDNIYDVFQELRVLYG
jgi:glycine/D-amino acid oxidase-like deaminating enzyme